MSTKNTKKKTGKNAKKKMKVSYNSPEKKDEASQKTGNILSQILSDSQTIQRLVVVDELSDEFWNLKSLDSKFS
ncbi:uncharacterized protein OCT59_007831 [Rhizophagus irregularis]|uniref:uncharacterized protein n=1 Tax=Rhizophagus irregularis TaxID=588596 RepID=UPI0033288F7C|nr:hypothetical protein OCT59_007831 [Rhizophagus irregularis]